MKIEYSFGASAFCPVDGSLDSYRVTLVSYKMIPAERILAVAASFSGRTMYQEEFAEGLRAELNCEVRVSGSHSGVDTVVTSGGMS